MDKQTAKVMDTKLIKRCILEFNDKWLTLGSARGGIGFGITKGIPKMPPGFKLRQSKAAMGSVLGAMADGIGGSLIGAGIGALMDRHDKRKKVYPKTIGMKKNGPR